MQHAAHCASRARRHVYLPRNALGWHPIRLRAQAAAHVDGPTSKKALGTGWTSSTVHRTPWAASRASAAALRADRGRRHTCWPQWEVRRVPQPSLQSGVPEYLPRMCHTGRALWSPPITYARCSAARASVARLAVCTHSRQQAGSLQVLEMRIERVLWRNHSACKILYAATECYDID